MAETVNRNGPKAAVYPYYCAQDELFSAEDSGRESRMSLGNETAASSSWHYDYLDEELHYMSPPVLDTATTEHLIITPEPLVDEGMMTPGTADYFSTPAVHLHHHKLQQLHPLSEPPMQPRRAVVR